MARRAEIVTSKARVVAGLRPALHGAKPRAHMGRCGAGVPQYRKKGMNPGRRSGRGEAASFGLKQQLAVNRLEFLATAHQQSEQAGAQQGKTCRFRNYAYPEIVDIGSAFQAEVSGLPRT